jgi:urease beta subunit
MEAELDKKTRSALVGRRVELVSTTDIYTNLQPGEQGTVSLVDSMGTLHVNWDGGNVLGLVPGEDVWLVLDK